MGALPAAPPIACHDLTRFYGATRGIEGLELTVEAGTVTGFLGPNGAGKTTVLRLLVGLLRPTRGEARLFGVPVHLPASRRSLGFMPADPAFVGALSGRENLDLCARLQGAASPDRASPDRDWALDLLDLDRAALDRPVRGYSSGMVQKLALVQAVQHRPALIVLDEPANRLDPLAHRGFERLVSDIARQGRTVFLSSHVLSEVEAVCDTVAMVRAGRLLLVATVAELAAGALRTVTVTYDHPPASLPAQLRDPQADGTVVRGRVAARSPETLRALLDEPGVVDLLVEPASLEETFLDLYAGDRSGGRAAGVAGDAPVAEAPR